MTRVGLVLIGAVALATMHPPKHAPPTSVPMTRPPPSEMTTSPARAFASVRVGETPNHTGTPGGGVASPTWRRWA